MKKTEKKLGLDKASFLINEETAEQFANEPLNPNGKSNAEVIRPFIVGEDILATHSTDILSTSPASLKPKQAYFSRRSSTYLL